MAGIIKVDQVQSDSNLAFNIAGSNVAFMNATSLQMVGSNVSLAGTNVITNGKVVTSAQPTGSVLQVVTSTITNAPSTTSGTYSSTGLSVTITPSSASNKILILPSLACAASGSQGFNSSGYFAIYRGASQINGDFILRSYVYSGAGTYLSMPGSSTYLDSPATTSATTYTIYFKTGASTATYLNADGQQSHLTVMEIAG